MLGSHLVFSLTLERFFTYLRGMHTNEFTQLRNFIESILPITDEEWSFHRNLLSRRRLFKGEFLIQVGEFSNHVSFINRGSLRAYWDVEGYENTKNFFFENEYACDYESFLSRKPSGINIRAMEDCELVELEHGSVQKLYEQHSVWQKYGRLIAETLFVHMAKRSRDLLSKTPEELYLDLINNRPHIIERMPLQYIASYLGVKPESLSRIRKRLMEVRKFA